MKRLGNILMGVATILGLVFLSGAIMVRPALAQPDKQFSNLSLRSTFAGGFDDGFFLSGTTILAHNGIQTLAFDGNGNITGTETFNILSTAGQLTCVGTVAGTYSLGPDGDGTLTLTFTSNPSQPGCPASSTVNGSFVVSDNVRGMDIVTTGNGTGSAVHIRVHLQRQ